MRVGCGRFRETRPLSQKDGPSNESRGKHMGGWRARDFPPIITKIIDIIQKDSMIPRFKHVELVQGDVCKIVLAYVMNNPGLRIALLHLDMHLYEPTEVALEYLYPCSGCWRNRVVR